MANGDCATMTLALDEMGRLVVPKPLRDKFLLKPGDELDITVETDGIKLRPHQPVPATATENGILVCASEVPVSAWDIPALIDRQREERSRETAGC